MAEPDNTTDELSLGKQPTLDPIGREIARMKIGDALFAKTEESARANKRKGDERSRRRALIVAVLVAVVAALAITMLR